MSRSGYTDECEDNWRMIIWRGAVLKAVRGKRGQAFLRELIAALDAMPEKRLIAGNLIKDGAVCALGCVGLRRGLAMEAMDASDHRAIAETFGIADALVSEVEYENDEVCWRHLPEHRWLHMRDWAARMLKDKPDV